MANFRHDKKIRTVVSMVVFFLAGSLLAAAPPAKKATTCRETTRRVLKPFEDKVAKAIKALETYEEKNATLILTLQKEISLRKGLLLKFPEKQRADAAEYDRKINAARQAISDAKTKAQKRLAELQKKLQQARDKKNKSLVASYKRSIESLRKSIAADQISAYSKELNIGHSVESWKLDIKARLAGKTKKMQAYQKKEVSLYFKPLSWSLNQKAMEEAIQKRETLLGEARARKPRHYLNILSWSYSGKEIDEYLAQQKAKLQDAKSRIAQGTFVLYVQRLSRRTDRNSVLALVAKAKQKYRKTHADWGTKTYSTYNKMLHGPITNGEIEKRLASRKKELADYRGLGDKVKATRLETLEKRVKHYQVVLKSHQTQWKEDLKKQKEKLDGYWKEVLAQTPCGGGLTSNPVADRVKGHIKHLQQISENDTEKKRRTDLFGDIVYIDRDGKVHGDSKKGLELAQGDLGIGKGNDDQSVEQWIIWMKNQADWLEGFLDANQIRIMNARINEIVRASESLGSLKLSNKGFLKKRKQLRMAMREMQKILDTGFLSPGKIEQYKKALLASRASRSSIQGSLTKLSQLQRRSLNAKEMIGKWKSLKNVAANLASDVAATREAFAQTSAKSLSSKGRQWLKGKSTFEKGMIVLSIANAAADAYDQIQRGVPVSEAVARASIDFSIDMAISGFPITAAAEMGTLILFNSYAFVTGDKAVSDATLSNTTKWVVRESLNTMLDYGSAGYVALAQWTWNEKDIPEIVRNADFSRVRNSLSCIEDQLASLPPGDPKEAKLMQARRKLRMLIRAQQGLRH